MISTTIIQERGNTSKLRDLTGLKFGKLTVLRRNGNHIFPSGKTTPLWDCLCECGNHLNVTSDNLTKSQKTSCGCDNIDAIGSTFGRFTIISKPIYKVGKDNRERKYYPCKCQCGEYRDVLSDNLLSGKSKSCGCLNNELFIQRTLDRATLNDYEFTPDICIGYTNKGIFLVDIEDYDKIKDFHWSINSDGYVVDNNGVKISRIIMDASSNIFVDHKHGCETRFDNRKSNLRLATVQQNNLNRKTYTNNKLGVRGVSRAKNGKYVAHIGFNYKKIHLGTFDTLEEAIIARKDAENKYFGEWSYDNSQKPTNSS